MRSSEKGITMVELIIAVALFFVIMPLIWNYINSSLEDSADINNKIVVQTTVNQVMNNLQKHVQEASMPITDSPINVTGKADAEEEDGESAIIELKKPGGVRVKYTYDNTTATVEYEMRDSSDSIVDSAEYGNISEFIVTYQPEERDENTKVNGLKVTVSGRIDAKSNYSLTNEYYTRNTI